MGRKNLATGEPMGLDTLFRIYSMTKPVTAVAMMLLHDEGLWRPEDPIAKHLPVFAGVKVLAGLDASGAPILEDPNHSPTMAELMTHTAGFSYGFDPASAVDQLYQTAGVWRSDSLREMVEKLADVPLAYQPGERWLYSLSMDVQGAIVEALSGQSLPDFMQSRIFGPLGMTDTAFHTPPDQRGRRAIIYRLSKTRGLVPAEQPLLPDSDGPPGLASGGGGPISTAMDYARFAQMLLNGGELAGVRIVSDGALRQMMSSQLSEDFIARRWG
jgi:CubicO group peptidase (beta-lactamase class C family)